MIFAPRRSCESYSQMTSTGLPVLSWTSCMAKLVRDGGPKSNASSESMDRSVVNSRVNQFAGGHRARARHHATRDTFFVAIARRIYDNGLPKTQGELVREKLDWFQARQHDHTPDASTVRRKVAMVWRELKRA